MWTSPPTPKLNGQGVCLCVTPFSKPVRHVWTHQHLECRWSSVTSTSTRSIIREIQNCQFSAQTRTYFKSVFSLDSSPVAMVTFCGSDRLCSGVKPGIQETSIGSTMDYCWMKTVPLAVAQRKSAVRLRRARLIRIFFNSRKFTFFKKVMRVFFRLNWSPNHTKLCPCRPPFYQSCGQYLI